MSLTTKQRSAIYEKFVPILGEEEAEALMAEFPATEHDQLVTRDHLRAELAEVRGELKGEIQAVNTGLRWELGGLETRLRAELHNELKAVRGELGTEIATLRGEVHDLSSVMTRSLLAIAGLAVSAIIGGMGLVAAVG